MMHCPDQWQLIQHGVPFTINQVLIEITALPLAAKLFWNACNLLIQTKFVKDTNSETICIRIGKSKILCLYSTNVFPWGIHSVLETSILIHCYMELQSSLNLLAASARSNSLGILSHLSKRHNSKNKKSTSLMSLLTKQENDRKYALSVYTNKVTWHAQLAK